MECPIAVDLQGANTRERIESPVDRFRSGQTCGHINPVRHQGVDVT